MNVSNVTEQLFHVSILQTLTMEARVDAQRLLQQLELNLNVEIKISMFHNDWNRWQ